MDICDTPAVIKPGTRIERDPVTGMTMFPRGNSRKTHGFSTSREAVALMRTFVSRRLAGADSLIRKPGYGDCDALLPVVVSLIPRPDNDYNPRAISVAMPPSDGGSPLDRHIGYLVGLVKPVQATLPAHTR
jgi:hypothetical protein